jgi:hypothetical protein
MKAASFTWAIPPATACDELCGRIRAISDRQFSHKREAPLPFAGGPLAAGEAEFLHNGHTEFNTFACILHFLNKTSIVAGNALWSA